MSFHDVTVATIFFFPLHQDSYAPGWKMFFLSGLVNIFLQSILEHVFKWDVKKMHHF